MGGSKYRPDISNPLMSDDYIPNDSIPNLVVYNEFVMPLRATGNSPRAHMAAGHSPHAHMAARHSPHAHMAAGNSPHAHMAAGHSPHAHMAAGNFLASFPGPAQLFVACSTVKRGEPGIFSHVSMT